MDCNLPFFVRGVIQHYAWGKDSKGSLIAKLVENCDGGKPCAELWIGSHPKGPAVLGPPHEDRSLIDLLSRYPSEILGETVFSKYGATLPFLFKVLSVNKPLSIQAHPDIVKAESLHASDPEHYPDSNHKPEIAIALSKFTLLFGFKPHGQLLTAIERYENLKLLIQELAGEEVLDKLYSADQAEEQSQVLKQLFSSLAEIDPGSALFKSARMGLETYFSRIKDLDFEELWYKRILSQYPEDPGLFLIFIMNLLTLEPGEAIFVGPNIPHSYLEGDLIECMANSDNTVRAGLTPKYRDVETLIDMLTYQQAPIVPLLPEELEGATAFQRYRLPIEEFSVDILRGGSQEICSGTGKVVLLFCLEGSAVIAVEQNEYLMNPGGALLVPAGMESYSINQHTGVLFRILA